MKKVFGIGDRVWYCGEGEGGGPESLGTIGHIDRPDVNGEIAYYVVWDDGSEGVKDEGYAWGELMREGETWDDFRRENSEMGI